MAKLLLVQTRAGAYTRPSMSHLRAAGAGERPSLCGRRRYLSSFGVELSTDEAIARVRCACCRRAAQAEAETAI